jgi:type I restriction enzyme S subunit
VKDLQSLEIGATTETITEAGLRNSAASIIPPNTVVIASRVGLGKASITLCSTAINQDLKALVLFNTDILPRYLLYYFVAIADQIERAGVGATVKGVTIEYLKTLELPLPPLSEQERIVRILDEAEALRRLRAQADERSSTLIPSLFEQMFGDLSSNPKRSATMRLRDICEKFSDGPFGSNLKSEHYTQEGIRVIRLQNIGVGSFIDDDKAFIAPQHFDRLRKHECLPGDVLVGTLGDPNLRACVLPSHIEHALNKADCVQIRPKPEQATAEYLCWLLNLPATLSMTSGMIAGQTRSRISMGRLAELMVPVPPIELQHAFATRVAEIRELRAAQAASCPKLDDLFQSILHRAFQGEL